ncbi:hypothetical protein EXIGLDRAFT_842356 [Exidia glandulosa HHB12029]|uniref:Transmembrane protein n=1 Tax=Exidia glandulosa HHB12029 TaxID=1314781 RepID=A0A165DCZ5_EXIGL|nr:hypothetical protein EXIGLDRAFT_842356 [Exidia glandulosa HHB12029]
MPSNITVDDTSPEIVYTGTWDPNYYPSSLAFNGSHRLSYDPTATATLKFKGIAVYYWAPLWPYIVNTTVTLDNGTSHFLDLTDYDSLGKDGTGQVETVLSQVRWSQTGLEDKEHTLVATMAPGAIYLVVDAITYTVSQTLPTPGAARARTLAIALGTSLALAVLLGCGFAAYFFFVLRGRWRWRRRGHTRMQSASFNLIDEMDGAPKQRPGSMWVHPTPPQLVPHPYSFSGGSRTRSSLDEYSPWVGMGPLASRVADEPSDMDGEWEHRTPTAEEDDILSATAQRPAPLPPGAGYPYMHVSNRDVDDDAVSVASSSSTRTRVQEMPMSTSKSDTRSRAS